jgi:hypothetical protein
MSSPSIILTTRVPPDLAARIDVAAVLAGVSRSAWLAAAAREHLRRCSTALPAEMRERVA